MKLTIKEALEQGYTLCGPNKGEWIHLLRISEMSPMDFDKEKVFIASKDFTTPTMDMKRLREMIADVMESDWGNDTGDDTEQVYRTINKMDMTHFCNQLNGSLENIKSYTLTDIELVP